MNREAVRWAWYEAPPEIDGTAHLVLLALCERANDRWQADPGVERLAAMTRRSRRSVEYALDKLERASVLSSQRRRRENALYTICPHGSKRILDPQPIADQAHQDPHHVADQDPQDPQLNVSKIRNLPRQEAQTVADHSLKPKTPETKPPTAAAEVSAGDTAAAATAMMRERGIDNPEELLAFAEPAAIIETHRRRPGASPQLLAHLIRKGGFSPAVDPRTNCCAADSQQATEWAAHLQRLEREHPNAMVLLAGSHPHSAHGDGWYIGLTREVLSFVPGRFPGQVLAKLGLPAPIIWTECAGAAATTKVAA